MSSIGSLKKTARERMRSFYWAAFTVNNIANFYNVYNWIGSLSRLLTGSKGSAITSLVPAFADLDLILCLNLALYPALVLGSSTFFLKLIRGEEVRVREVFGGFRKLFKALGLFFALLLTIGVPVILIVGFGAVVGNWLGLGLGFRAIVGSVAAVAALFLFLDYAVVFYVLAENPNLSVLQVMERSRSIMNGRKPEYALLGLSFCGWILLDLFLLFGLVRIFVYPYIEAAFATFYINATAPKQLEG